VFVSDLRKDWDARAIRLAAVAHHYRTPWEWDETVMAAATTRLERWIVAGAGDGGLHEARAALDDDLDTPTAVQAIDAAVAAGLGVGRAAALLGVDIGS
jgi:L-cysteine:1D-myo-inositol 2-amino-2-deoxy-alpha-D-glucopyranoside ligase